MRKIVKYCRTDHLSQLEIVIRTRKSAGVSGEIAVLRVDDELLIKVQPFFRNLQKLTLRCYNPKYLDPTFFEQINFPNLKILRLEQFVSHENWMQIFPNQQICTNLTEFHLKSLGCRNFHAIFQFLPNIKLLSIWQVEHFHQPPVQARRIVQAIKKNISARRGRNAANDHVHLLVNQVQYNEFKAIKNIDDIIRMTVIKSEYDIYKGLD